jgi:hypothetical protein
LCTKVTMSASVFSFNFTPWSIFRVVENWLDLGLVFL